MGNGANMWFGGGFMWIFWILLIIIIAWLINSVNNRGIKEDSPLDLLKKRFARGDIDEQEYESKLKELDN